MVKTKSGDEDEDEFWKHVGNKDDVKSSRGLNKPLLEPRLFHLTKSRAFEIFNFSKKASHQLSFILNFQYFQGLGF